MLLFAVLSLENLRRKNDRLDNHRDRYRSHVSESLDTGLDAFKRAERSVNPKYTVHLQNFR